MAASRDEYAQLGQMFKELDTLKKGTAAHQRLREAIIAQSLPLADHIARRFSNRGESQDDLVQVARVGLVNAVNRFDVGNGADFLSFAIPTMIGEVRRHFRDRGWAVKVPRAMKECQPQLSQARDTLSQQLGRAPSIRELAEHLGMPRSWVVDAVIAASNYNTVSTDHQVHTRNEVRPIAESFGGPDPKLDKLIDVETVRPLIARLPERQRTVLASRFFENMTQTQIAAHIGCSQMHVSRLLTKALRTVREQADDGTSPDEAADVGDTGDQQTRHGHDVSPAAGLHAEAQVQRAIEVLMSLRGCSRIAATNELLSAARETGVALPMPSVGLSPSWLTAGAAARTTPRPVSGGDIFSRHIAAPPANLPQA